MAEVLISGKSSFKIEVPYKLVETGPEESKPLIVYLHGYKQNLTYFKRKTRVLQNLDAYHLFLEGPYPIYDEEHKREVAKWGRAWYLYDGKEDQFIKSMELTSEFIQELVDTIRPQIEASRMALFGYSMGGYLAGYFALSRPNYVNELVVVGGRIKIERFPDKSYTNLNVLALHGKKDKSVAANQQENSCKILQSSGANVTFEALNEQHQLNNNYLKKVKKWFTTIGYSVR